MPDVLQTLFEMLLSSNYKIITIRSGLGLKTIFLFLPIMFKLVYWGTDTFAVVLNVLKLRYFATSSHLTID